MTRRYLNPNLFFYFEDGELIVNNYETNEEYSLEPEYFECLRQIATGAQEATPDPEIVAELEEGALVQAQERAAPTWGWDVISRIFHFGTQYELPLVDRAQQLAQQVEERRQRYERDLIPVFTYRSEDVEALPPAQRTALEAASLDAVLKQRRTCRDFLGESVSLQCLSNLLHGTFGLLHGEATPTSVEPPLTVRRAYPSGGNVHAEEIYVVAYRVEGLASGLYHYQPREHALGRVRQGDFEEQVVLMNNCQYYSEGLAFGIYVAARLPRSWWKYPISRAYRMLLMDIGHAAQTFQLVAAAYGLQTWQTGAFDEARVNRFLELAQPDESAFVFLGCGRGTEQAYPAEYLAAFAALAQGEAGSEAGADRGAGDPSGDEAEAGEER